MSTVKNNNIFEKTSFLGGNSSEFIEELYSQYVQNPKSISKEWREFFDGLKDKKEEIINTANGPSWSRKKSKINLYKNGEELENNDKELKDINFDASNIKQNSKDSIRASTLIRAYRIRGHLLANLDPLGLQKRQEHPELNAETYGFNKDSLKVINALNFDHEVIDNNSKLWQQTERLKAWNLISSDLYFNKLEREEAEKKVIQSLITINEFHSKLLLKNFK